MTLPDELSAKIMRKQPVQKRAQLTIDAIFEATSQIVDREGVGGLTTNKIAAKAGFSVGTLYQYFSSKEAIFRAMSQHARSLAFTHPGTSQRMSFETPLPQDLEQILDRWRSYLA